MSNLIPVPADEERDFSALFSDTTYDRAEFKLELTDHPPATYGPRVKTIKIFWKDGVIAEYGAADATGWAEQFRADWDSGLIPEILEERVGL